MSSTPTLGTDTGDGVENLRKVLAEKLSEGRPVALSFSGHVAAAVGSRLNCCRDPMARAEEEEEKACRQEIKFFDSLEKNQLKDNWFSAESALDDTNGVVTYTVPCREKSDPPSGLEICVPHIQGKSEIKIAKSSIDAGDIEHIRSLLRSGALSPNGDPKEGWRPLEEAIDSNDPRLVELLLEAGAKAQIGNYNAILQAANKGLPDILDVFLRRGWSLNAKYSTNANAKNDSGTTLLQAAVGAGKSGYPAVKFLLAKGADFKVTEKITAYGYGPEPLKFTSNLLHKAVDGTGADVHTVRLLLQNGLDPNEPEVGGLERTALHLAARWAGEEKRTSILTELCKKGANPNRKNKNGESALDIVKKSQYQPAIDLLSNHCPTK